MSEICGLRSCSFPVGSRFLCVPASFALPFPLHHHFLCVPAPLRLRPFALPPLCNPAPLHSHPFALPPLCTPAFCALDHFALPWAPTILLLTPLRSTLLYAPNSFMLHTPLRSTLFYAPYSFVLHTPLRFPLLYAPHSCALHILLCTHLSYLSTPATKCSLLALSPFFRSRSILQSLRSRFFVLPTPLRSLNPRVESALTNFL